MWHSPQFSIEIEILISWLGYAFRNDQGMRSVDKVWSLNTSKTWNLTTVDYIAFVCMCQWKNKIQLPFFSSIRQLYKMCMQVSVCGSDGWQDTANYVYLPLLWHNVWPNSPHPQVIDSQYLGFRQRAIIPNNVFILFI